MTNMTPQTLDQDATFWCVLYRPRTAPAGLVKLNAELVHQRDEPTHAKSGETAQIVMRYARDSAEILSRKAEDRNNVFVRNCASFALTYLHLQDLGFIKEGS